MQIMDIYFILAQCAGAVALILTIIGIQFGKKDKIILFYFFADVFLVIEFFLLGSIAGALMNLVSTLRCFIYYTYDKHKLKTPFATMIMFEIATIATGVIFWQNIWSLIIIIANLTYNYGTWQENVLILKITAFIQSSCWIIYDLISKAYVSMLQECFLVIATLIAIIVILHHILIEKKQNKIKNKNSLIS